jgi:hypothetical protein
MKSILLISDTLLDLAALGASYSPVGIVDIQSQQRLVVEGEWGWFALNQEPEAEAELDEVELAQIRRSFTTPFYIQLEFSSPRAVDVAVSNFTAEVPLLVDNDFGLIRPIDEVRASIAAGKSWLTSASPPPDSPP